MTVEEFARPTFKGGRFDIGEGMPLEARGEHPRIGGSRLAVERAEVIVGEDLDDVPTLPLGARRVRLGVLRMRTTFKSGRPVAPMLVVLLVLLSAGCEEVITRMPVYDEFGESLFLENRSEQPVWIFFEDSFGAQYEGHGPIPPGLAEPFGGLALEEQCVHVGAWVLRDEEGRELARRDNTENPVCVDEPWVWQGH